MHGAFHPDMLTCPSCGIGDDVPAKLKALSLYGETDGSLNEEGLPIRTYAWVDRIPSGLTVLVEHDTRQMHEPLVIDNADGGRTVFLDTGAAKGGRLSTPSDLGTGTTAEIEEERRLLYVAMTRAKDDLHLIVPQRFFTHGQSAQGDRHVYASRTRFIPNGLVGLFEKAAWPAMAASSAAPVTRQGARIDIGARMRKMWQ